MRGLSIVLFCFANVAFAGAETNSLEYIVRSGDTLWGIAREYETSYEKLCTLNNKPNGWSKIKTGQKIIVPMTQPYFSDEEFASLGTLYQGEPKNADMLNEYGDQALFVGETDADVEFNKTNETQRCDSLFLKRRNKDGMDEWRLLLTTGSDWREADGMDKWSLGLSSDIKTCLNIVDAKFTSDKKYVLMICDTDIYSWNVACAYNIYDRSLRVFMDGFALLEQSDRTFLIKNKKTYFSDKNGEPLGARWYDVWITPDGKVVKKGKLKTKEEVD